MTIDLAPYSALVSLAEDAAKGLITWEQFYLSPQMVAARKAILVQQAKDQATKNATTALETGDVSGVEKDLS